MSIQQVLDSRQIENIVELYHFTFQGNDYYFTNHNIAVTPEAGNPVYEPYYLKRGEIIQDLTLDPKELVIEVSTNNDLFKNAAIYKGIAVEVSMAFLPDYPGNTFVEETLLYSGEQSSEAMKNSAKNFEFVFIQTELKKLFKYVLTKRIQKTCNNILFDKHCSLVKASWEDIATVSAVDKNSIESSDFATKPDAYYYLGEAVLVKGGITERRMITAHMGDTIQVQYNFGNLEAGDQITVTPGCDKKAETCLNTFSNIINFSGAPYMPEETK